MSSKFKKTREKERTEIDERTGTEGRDGDRGVLGESRRREVAVEDVVGHNLSDEGVVGEDGGIDSCKGLLRDR